MRRSNTSTASSSGGWRPSVLTASRTWSPSRSTTTRSWTRSISVDTTSPGGRSTRMSSATQGWRSSWTTWSPWIRGGRAGSRSAARPRCSVAGARRSAPASPRICSASARSSHRELGDHGKRGPRRSLRLVAPFDEIPDDFPLLISELLPAHDGCSNSAQRCAQELDVPGGSYVRQEHRDVVIQYAWQSPLQLQGSCPKTRPIYELWQLRVGRLHAPHDALAIVIVAAHVPPTGVRL